MKGIKVKYEFENQYDSSKNIKVELEGKNRKDLIDKLISTKNDVVLYRFLKYFPNLSDDEKVKITSAITDINNIPMPKKRYLITTETFYYHSDTLEGYYWL